MKWAPYFFSNPFNGVCDGSTSESQSPASDPQSQMSNWLLFINALSGHQSTILDLHQQSAVVGLVPIAGQNSAVPVHH
uniref:Uncharacterized protein n=1 Tax=Cucumis sativus TaxID=3659 RepID=A0A0A0K396_CUCSA